jgi:transcription antitermination factor NusG
LTRAGIESFLPTVEKLSKWKDRRKLVTFPLFPGYLFVFITPDHQNRLAVLKTNGVVRFLGDAHGEPEPVPAELIESLKRIIENHTPLDPYPYLTEGQRVRIKRGPLAGIEGILVKRVGLHMLVLSVDVLQQGAALRIETFDVENL